MSHAAAIRAALTHGDITTTGCRSGQPRRTEIVFHVTGDRLYLSGWPYPRKRDWLRNLEADPHLTVHLKETVRADLPATARVIEEEWKRRTILAEVARIWRRDDLEAMVCASPLIAVTIDA